MGKLPSDELKKIATDFRGQATVYIKDLESGDAFEHNPDLPLPTASICKVPVMIELFKQAEQGKLSLQDRRRRSDDISAHGTGTLSMLYDEPELSLYDYARLMIYVSDNMATDVLIELLTPGAINATMDELGFTNTRTSVTLGEYHYRFYGNEHLPRNRENDAKNIEISRTKGLDPNSISYEGVPENNITSGADMGRILEQLHAGQIVSPDASAAMIELLKGCRSNNKIPRYLDTGITVAHKIGGSNRIQGDVGIVYLPTGPLVVSVVTLADELDVRGGDTIAELSKMAVGALSPESVALEQ